MTHFRTIISYNLNGQSPLWSYFEDLGVGIKPIDFFRLVWTCISSSWSLDTVLQDHSALVTARVQLPNAMLSLYTPSLQADPHLDNGSVRIVTGVGEGRWELQGELEESQFSSKLPHGPALPVLDNSCSGCFSKWLDQQQKQSTHDKNTFKEENEARSLKVELVLF